MSPQTAQKFVTATLTLSDIRHHDAEIHELIVSKKSPALIAEYLKRKFGNSSQLQVKIAENQAELKWSIPSSDPEAENLHREAMAYAKQRDFSKAITRWTQALAKNPHDPDYYFNLGIACFANKNYKEAVENFQQAVSLCPIYHRAHLILGTILLKMRKFADAEGHLKESIYFDPRNALAHLNLGAVYSILKKYKEGIASFQRAIELSPNEVRAYFGLAKIFAILGDTENANLNYRKVIELDKQGTLAAHAKRGIVTTGPAVEVADLESLYSEGYKAFLYSDFKGAARMYQKYLEKKPDDDQVWAVLGVALQRAGAPDRALKAFAQAGKLNPTKGLYFKQLGIACDLVDRPAEALKAFEQAGELGKGDSVMLSVWGKNLIKLNRLTEAIPQLERAVKLNRSNLLAHYYLATALMKMNEVERAITHLEAVMGAKVNTPLKEQAQELRRKVG